MLGLNMKRQIDTLTGKVWTDNLGGISWATQIIFDAGGTGTLRYVELGVEDEENFDFNYKLQENKIQFKFPDYNIDFIFTFRIKLHPQKNIYNELIREEPILILSNHPYYLLKDLLEKADNTPEETEFYIYSSCAE